MTITTHPRPEELAAFARGELVAEELASVAEHISVCGACCTIVARIPSDTLTDLARAAGDSDFKLKTVSGQVAEPVPVPVPTCRPPEPPTPAHRSEKIPPALADHPRYEVQRQLGAGGMGVVYKAEHRVMGRLVALKVMAPHLTAKKGAVERFRKEVRAAAQLNHPNIVTAHDADEADGLHFLVMEFVEGTSLDRLVARKGPLPVPLTCSILKQAALGLQNAHEKGMVHRDIKPQNIMVTRKAQVKIMDFGLARFVHDEEDSSQAGRLPFGAAKTVADPLTNPNLLMGTPDYLSPEQAKNSHDVDSRSDLYSLGCTLFFLLTGKPPFAHAPSLIDKLLAHTEEPPPLIRDLRPDVPEGVAAVLEKLLAKNPDDRFDSAAEVAVAIREAVEADAEAESRPNEIDALEAPISGIGLATPASGVGLRTVAAVVPGIATGDTEPVARERTILESDRPRKSRRLKRPKPRPWWEQTRVKIAATVMLPLVVVIAIIIVGKAKVPPPPATPTSDNTTKAQPTPAAGKTPPVKVAKSPKVLPFLLVVPSQGIHRPDYFPMKQRLIDAKISVVTASGLGGTSAPALDPNGIAVPVDVKLADVDPSEYSGVAFCGSVIDEYIDTRGKGSPITRTTHTIIEHMFTTNKPIGGIGDGEGVLAIHGALDGKSAAKSPMLMKDYPTIIESKIPVTWRDQRVVVAGKVITARGASDAEGFADALIEALRAE